MQLSDQQIVQQTLNWVSSFIVKLNICPFAKREFERKSVRTSVIRSKKVDVALEELISEMLWLDQHSETETSLLIFPTLFKSFHHYLDFVALADDLLLENGYEGIYQMATFHPDYCFAGADPEDAANYTNRSPYPMIHLLRENSVAQAIDFYGDTSVIPEDNIKLMTEIGSQKLQETLASIMALEE